MCFSAGSSFVAAAVLVPVGGWCVLRSLARDPMLLPLALFPLAFGVQQAIEGMVWTALDAGDASGMLSTGRGFLFFSHFFWPAFAPFAVMWAEPEPLRRRALGWLAVLGTLFGLSIMVPAVLLPGWLEVGITGGSIDYRTTLIYDGFVGRGTLKVVYAAIVVMAFFVSSRLALRLYGAAILTSVLAVSMIAPAVFISVWCFVAAWLSLCLVLVLLSADDGRETAQPTPT